MRLAKYLARSGVASRRRCEQLVRAGRVSLSGTVVFDPALEVEEGAAVAVDGKSLAGPEPAAVYLLHKPVGVLSTAHDPFGRPTVVELVDSPYRLYPVGRLDRDSSGLLLLTNNGDLAYRLSHPSFEVGRAYRVRVAGTPSPEAVARLRQGVRLADGPTGPCRVRRLAPNRFELELREGRNRQVRRMWEAVGYPVLELQRVAFGPLRLGRLPAGAWRPLGGAEVAALLNATAQARRRGGRSLQRWPR